MKPPISKAKMTAITKAAIRAIKFYKHVVQSVEKFIQKVYIVILEAILINAKKDSIHKFNIFIYENM